MAKDSDWTTAEMRRLRRRAGLTLEELARAMGYNSGSGIQRYEDAAQYSKRYFSRDLVDKMVPALVGKGKPAITAVEVLALAGVTHPVTPIGPFPGANVGGKVAAAILTKTIPVYRQAVGGRDGLFIKIGNKVEDVLCPHSLVDVRGAYGVYVYGDSMEPRYFDGERIFVDPQCIVVKGNFVVVQIRNRDDPEGAPLAYVKQFVRWNSSGLNLSQYNPKDDLVFAAEDVISVHRVVSSEEP